MKYALKAIVGILFLCTLVVIITPFFINVNDYRSDIVKIAKEKTGLDVHLNGDLGFSILPAPSLFLEDVLIKEVDADDTLIEFKKLNVNLDFMTLLSGNVSVTSLNLIDPKMVVVKHKDGSMNIKKIIDSFETNKENDVSTIDAKGKQFAPEISFNAVDIRNGTIIYRDDQAGEEKSLSNINTQVSAKSLTGPFNIDGSIFYDGLAFEFDVETDQFNTSEKVLNIKVDTTIQPYNANLKFSGVLNMSGAFEVQGHTALLINSLSELSKNHASAEFSKPLKISAITTVNENIVEASNIEGVLGEDAFSGSFQLDAKSFKTSVDLKTDTPISLNKLSFASSLPYKKASFNIRATGDHKAVQLKNTSITLDDDQFNVSGGITYAEKPNASNGKPNLDLNIKTKAINLDKVLEKENTKAINSNAKGHKAAASSEKRVFPINGRIDFSADTVIYKGEKASDLSAEVKLSQNKITLDNVSFSNYLGSSLKVSGDVQDVQNLTGITLYADFKTSNARALLSKFKVDISAIPKSVNSGSVKLKLAGDMNASQMTANMNAMGGELIAKGDVQNLSNTPSFQNLVVQIKHNNLAQMMNLLTGAKIKDPSLNKPLDFYTKINQSDATYELSGIKGKVAGAGLTGNLIVDIGSATPYLKGSLDFGSVKIASVVEKESPKSVSKNTGTKATSARWSKDPINTSLLHAINLDVALKADKIEYGDWPLQSPALNINLKDGRLLISDLTAGVFGGNVKINAELFSKGKDREPIHFQTSNTFTNVDLAQLSSALVAKNLVKISGDGNMTMTMDATGLSPAALIHDLSGEGRVKASDIILEGVDVVRFVRALSDESKPGDTVMGLWGGSTQGGTTHFDTLDGVFQINQGVVNISKMDLDGTQATIQTKGQINLSNWTIATKHKMSVKGTDDVPSDVPPFEVSLSGSLDNPAQTFGQGVLQDYLNRKLQRKFNKLLSDKLGDKLGLPPANDNQPLANEDESSASSSQQNNAQQPKEPQDIEDVAEEAIKGIIGDLLR